jgi:hypothetical protein
LIPDRKNFNFLKYPAIPGDKNFYFEKRNDCDGVLKKAGFLAARILTFEKRGL